MPKFTNTGKLIKRKGTNFFTKVSVSSITFSSHSVSWDFTAHGIFIMVESNHEADVVEYSFDGSELHGDMTPRLPSEAIIFDNRYVNHIWFRRASAGPPVMVRIEAWRNDS